jgi:2-polyprenyl-6-methoxyphenol hydroxylase-like FAD-dependent oxidoreductase
MRPVDVIIVGGSLGGLMAANCLLRAGVSVLVLEKSAVALDGRGAGIVTHSQLLSILERCGVQVDDTLGVKVDSRVVLAANGGELARERYPQILTSWGRLYHLLVRALPAQHYVLNAGVTRVESLESHAIVHCTNGQTYQAGLVIAADGIRSAVRTQLAPTVKPTYAGYVAWRGICDEASLSANTLHTLFGHFGFGLPDHEQMLGYPVAGAGNDTRIGKRCYNFVWYRPAVGDTLKQLMTDADGIEYSLDNGGGIAPQKVSWRQIAQVREAAMQLLAPQFAEILQKTAQPFLQPIFDLSSTQIAFDRVGILGDAAFVARPHVGMGVTKAAQDAAALTDAILSFGAKQAALKAYEAQRLAPGASIVQRGRQLGAYMESQSFSAKEFNNADVARSAQKVMHETAIDLALRATSNN